MIRPYHIIYILSGFIICSCSTKIISNNYYQENKIALDEIEKNYARLNAIKPFAVAFTNKDLTNISLELLSDTLNRVYDFDISDKNLVDTLYKFRYDTLGIISLVKRMQKTKVTWINSFDYYTNDQPNRLIYLSIKPVTIRYPFTPPKFISLAYFRTAQSFDEKGRLLDGRKTKRIRKLNGQIYYRITDRICYTIAEKFR